MAGKEQPSDTCSGYMNSTTPSTLAYHANQIPILWALDFSIYNDHDDSHKEEAEPRSETPDRIPDPIDELLKRATNWNATRMLSPVFMKPQYWIPEVREDCCEGQGFCEHHDTATVHCSGLYTRQQISTPRLCSNSQGDGVVFFLIADSMLGRWWVSRGWVNLAERILQQSFKTSFTVWTL